MKKVLLVVVLSTLLATASLNAADWPQWGGTAAKNMVSLEKGLPETFVRGNSKPQGDGIDLSTTKNVKWAVRTADFSCSTPTVAGDKVFVGGMVKGQGVLDCFNEETGKMLWRWMKPCRSDLKADAMNFRHFPKSLGVCSTAAVDGDRVYFVDQNCVVECLATSGASGGQAKSLWSFDMFGDKDVGSRPSDACNGSPLVDGDILYVTTSNGVDRIVERPIEEDGKRKCMAPNAPTIIALDKRTGRLLARDAARITPNMLHGQWSSPSVATVQGRRLVVLGGGDGNCYAFEALPSKLDESTADDRASATAKLATLKIAWSYDCNPPAHRAFGGMDMFVHYTLGDRRRSDSLNKSNDGSFVGLNEIVATPVFYKDRIYVAIGRDPEHGRGRGALHCIDATKSGDVTKSANLWTYEGLDRTLCTVSISDGLLYISDVAGRLHCLDAETGQVYWVYESNSQTIASTMVADGKIYMPTTKYLYVLAAGKTKTLLSKISLGGPTWVTPVAANGTLFVASRNYLWAVKESSTFQPPPRAR